MGSLFILHDFFKCRRKLEAALTLREYCFECCWEYCKLGTHWEALSFVFVPEQSGGAPPSVYTGENRGVGT